MTKSGVQRRPSDEELAVKVALEALGMKLVVSEADYPMLCESTRLQRGDLALTMLLRSVLKTASLRNFLTATIVFLYMRTENLNPLTQSLL